MTAQKTATLKTIFSDVLANLAFMFTDDIQAEPSREHTWLETAIGYEGRRCGTLRFWCTRDFTALLAANLLGIDPQDPAASGQGEDAIKEFMNIVCGQYVTTMHGDQDTYNLTIPKVTELTEPPELLDDDETTACTFNVDVHVIQLAYEPYP